MSMKRALVILSVLTGLALVGYGALYLAYGDFARGVIDDGRHMGEWRAKATPMQLDTCRYMLRIPADLDYPETPHFDTTIVRNSTCKSHLLHFPAWGTRSDYVLSGNGVSDSLGFFFEEEQLQWLDVSALPAGIYRVRLLACGNGGDFTVKIQ